MLSLKKYKVSTSGERCWDNSGSPATFPSLFLPDFHPSASIPTNRSFPVSVLPCSTWTARVALASPAVDVDTVKTYLVIASGTCRRTLFFDPTSGNRLLALAAEHVESRFSGTRAGPVLTTVLLRSKLVGGPHRVLALRSLTTAAIPASEAKRRRDSSNYSTLTKDWNVSTLRFVQRALRMSCWLPVPVPVVVVTENLGLEICTFVRR